MIFITIVHHSNGEFIVYKNVGSHPKDWKEREGNRFATFDDAHAYAKRLQAEAGGPAMAKIREGGYPRKPAP